MSHNAPYKHFAEKSELLAAVSAAGFELLTKRIADQIARMSSSPLRPMASTTSPRLIGQWLLEHFG